MSTEPGPLESLTEEEQEVLVELARARVNGGVSRRGLLEGAGYLGLGALLGGGGAYAATGPAQAATGQWGTDADPLSALKTASLDGGGSAVSVGDSLTPDADATHDLGSSSNAWNTAFTSEIQNPNYVEPQVTASSGTSYNADLTSGNYHKVTMTGDVTFDFTNPDGSDVNSLMLHLVQDATGSRSPSFTPTVVWADGSAPSWSTAANAEDVATFVHDQDGSQWLGFEGGLNFS